MIEVPAVIDKKDIAILGALKGMANEGHVSIGGNDYKQSTIVFRGFAGAIRLDDRRYHGVVRFDECERADCLAWGDFSPIVRAMDINESEVDDGLHGEDNGID